MNDTIKELQDKFKNTEMELKRKQFLLNNINEALRKAVADENYLLRKVLDDNFPDVVQMIYKRGLRLTEIIDTGYETGYTVHKGIYSAKVMVQGGTLELVKMDNDGCGQSVEEVTEDLIRLDLIPFVEKKKNELIEKERKKKYEHK